MNLSFNLFKIILFFVLFLGSKTYAQGEPDFISYHKEINTAEVYIAKAEYKNALGIYQGIFNEFPHAFYKDYYNATLCAIKEKKFENALNYSKQLVLHGYKMEDFEKPAFDDLRNNPGIWQLFLSEYTDLREKYENSINLPLREKYLALFKIDQHAASTGTGVSVRCQDSILNKLSGEVSELIKEHGFPQWFINKDTINPKIHVMLRHYCGLVNRIDLYKEMQNDGLYINIQDYHIDSLANDALRQGWLMPEQFISITTYYQSPNPYGKLAVVIDFKTETVKLHFPVSPDQQEEINRRRDNIGLPPASEFSDDMLAGTKWSQYPFKEIKEAWAACDTCKWGDYSNIETYISNEYENKYKEGNRNDFILNDYNSINETWINNSSLFQKNKITREELEEFGIYDFDTE